MPTLSLATVYKTLDALAGSAPCVRSRGWARAGAGTPTSSRTTTSSGTSCGTVTDVAEPRLEAAARPAAALARATASRRPATPSRSRTLRRLPRPAPHRQFTSARRESNMAETMTASVKLGQKVPDFEMVTYEPTKGDFGKFSMRDQIASKALDDPLFYPADFTFV